MVQAKVVPAQESRQTIAGSLLPLIDQAMQAASWKKDELDALVVGIGPGSFTGIRSGIVVARTIGQALCLPVVGVSLLDCLGHVLENKLPAAVVLKAGTNKGIIHYFACGYAPGKNGPTFVVEPCYLASEKLGQVLSGLKTWFADPDLQSLVVQQGGTFASLPVVENVAVVQGQIAFSKLSAGNSDHRCALSEEWSYAKVTPLYLRGPSITLKSCR